MAKTLVAPSHDPGPLPNGDGHCHTRWANHGVCSGVSTAQWLNGLGDDNEPYANGNIQRNGKIVTNGDVRRNWLAEEGLSHVRKAVSHAKA